MNLFIGPRKPCLSVFKKLYFYRIVVKTYQNLEDIAERYAPTLSKGTNSLGV